MEPIKNPIKHDSAELILNPDGSVYHLHLKPEELADTVLLVGDPGRVPMVSAYFDALEVQKEHREFITHTGRLGGQRISVISTGIGTDNIDIVLNELDALVNIDLQTHQVKSKHHRLNLIRIGTSGALQADLDVDSCIVSAYGLGLDSLLHFYQTQTRPDTEKILGEINRQFNLPFLTPYLFAADSALLNLFSTFPSGITVTGNGFYGPQGRTLRASARYPDLLDRLTAIQLSNTRITNFEMETAAIYGLAALLGHRALSVNAIIANRIQNRFSSNPGKTVLNTIEEVIRLLPGLSKM
ncbi:MAG: nucleoside phosphorylase [Bacteroidia bacterium]|jgi:uridine phosphorylase